MTPEDVATSGQLADFLEELRARVRDAPGSVPNVRLEDFLSGAAGWVGDIDAYFGNRGESTPDEPTWSLVAAIFAAATMYE